MVQIAGKYEHVRSVGFVEMLIAKGMPEDRAKQADQDKHLEVILNGDQLTVSYGKKAHSLVLDKEVEETGPNNDTMLTTAHLDGSTISIQSKFKDGQSNSRDLIFTDEGVEVKFQSRDGIEAKRIYKRV